MGGSRLVVEVVRGATTRDEEVKKGATFVSAIGKFPLITKDVPGFLVNKVLTPYMFAAMQKLEQGEDKEKIDEAVRAFGMPMGPIELADNVGLDVCAHVAKILGQSSEGSRLERLVASGRLGKKTPQRDAFEQRIEAHYAKNFRETARRMGQWARR